MGKTGKKAKSFGSLWLYPCEAIFKKYSQSQVHKEFVLGEFKKNRAEKKTSDLKISANKVLQKKALFLQERIGFLRFIKF